jgi:transposase-like protein
MYDVAKTVRGFTPLDDPARKATVDLSARLAAHVERGVSMASIARAIGVSTSTVLQRLARHGHRAPSASVERAVYKHRLGGRVVGGES